MQVQCIGGPLDGAVYGWEPRPGWGHLMYFRDRRFGEDRTHCYFLRDGKFIHESLDQSPRLEFPPGSITFTSEPFPRQP